jgi:hypothetical protein
VWVVPQDGKNVLPIVSGDQGQLKAPVVEIQTDLLELKLGAASSFRIEVDLVFPGMAIPKETVGLQDKDLSGLSQECSHVPDVGLGQSLEHFGAFFLANQAPEPVVKSPIPHLGSDRGDRHQAHAWE